MEYGYGYVKRLYDESLVNVSMIESNLQMVMLSMIGFFLPFILGHPQILVGIFVNATLIIGATYLRGHKILPLILLPSLGVLSAGLLFGTYTIYLLYLVPFIWVANALYVYLFKHFEVSIEGKKRHAVAIVISSISKAAFLFAITLLLVQLTIVPAIFLTAMGILQLVTALIGGALAQGIVTGRELLVSKN